MDTAPPLGRSLMTFLRIGAWGLGAAKHTYLYDAFVRRQRVIGEEDYIDSLSVSQVLPGPNMLNVAIACGFRLRGIPLAVLGGLVIVLPGMLIVAVLTVLAFNAAGDPVVAGALRGITIGACAFVGMNLLRMVRRSVHAPHDLLLGAACFALAVLGLPLVANFALLGGLSLLVHRRAAGA